MVAKNWQSLAIAILTSAIISGGTAVGVVGASKADEKDLEEVKVRVEQIQRDYHEAHEDIARIEERQETIQEDVREIKDDMKEILERLPR